MILRKCMKRDYKFQVFNSCVVVDFWSSNPGTSFKLFHMLNHQITASLSPLLFAICLKIQFLASLTRIKMSANIYYFCCRTKDVRICYNRQRKNTAEGGQQKKKNNKLFILLKSQMDQVACSGRQLSGCQFVFIALTQTATAATLLVANDKSTHRLSRRLKHAKLLHYKLFQFYSCGTILILDCF